MAQHSLKPPPAREPSRALCAGVALAALSFALGAPDAKNVVAVQLTPAGEFTPSDGRPMKVRAWHIDAASAARVIDRLHKRRTRPVVDYEHQTLLKEKNGQPAPAAGWITDLTWSDGQGLFATVQLTQRAAAAIAAGEYRYVSPVFTYDQNGAVLDIRMAALTNTPAIDGMQPLELAAAATFGLELENPMSHDKLFAAVTAAFNLDVAKATDEEAITALTARLEADPLTDVRAALGAAADADATALVAVCAALKAKAEATGAAEPDPAKFVPVAVVRDLQTQVAALTAKQIDGEVGDLVAQGLVDGRLLPAQKDWATALGKKDVAALTAYLASAEPIAALRQTQTRGAPPPTGTGKHGLTADELAVCNACGVAPEDFAKTKQAA